MSKSRKTAEKTIFATFKILKDAGGELLGKEVVDKVRETVELSEYEKERYEKTGYVRWESILHFYTIDCIKAGFLRKQKGKWILTDEGEEAINLGPEKLLYAATKAYRKWKKSNIKEEETPEKLIENSTKSTKSLLDQYESDAIDGIREFIKKKNPYEFQELVATLLSSMGYFISHIASRGKDGGIDVIAYSDPLGAKEPRIKVQVKHRPDTSIAVTDIRQLIGLLSKQGDVGLFVTSGRFTADSEREARESHKHIELIDFSKLIDLWQKYYLKMTDEQKNILPLQAIYFLGSNE